MSQLVTLDLALWRPTLTPDAQRDAALAIEGGAVLVLPHLPFALSEDERRFLSPTWSDGRAKNVSLDGSALKGARGSAKDLADLAAMIARFAANAADLVTALFPAYAPYVKRARTSYRPQPAVGRAVSWRKDDSRLHVDAFPSRPNRGERILRVFSNVSPDEPRIWRVAAARRGPCDQGRAHGIRSPDARAARPREGRPCVPARLRAGNRAFRPRHDLALLFRPGHARRGVRPIHAGADDQPATVRALRARSRAARDPRAPDGPCVDALPLIPAMRAFPGCLPGSAHAVTLRR